MNIELESMAIEMPALAGHPNRVPFHGVLTLVDVPSDRPPAGARGHRVLLTRAAAEAALPSLLGMALDFSPALDGHDARRKIGIITSAEIAGRRLKISGYLFARDFPEVVREMRAAPAGELGMSYEVCDARIADTRAATWKLLQVTFTGAAVLRRDKAAYRQTAIEVAAEMPLGGGRSSLPAALRASRKRGPSPNPKSYEEHHGRTEHQ